MATFAQSARSTYHQELQGHRLSFTAFKQTPWYMGAKFSVERSQLTLRMPYFDNEIVALSYQAPLAAARSHQPALRLIAEGNPALGTIETDRGLAGKAILGVRQARHLLRQFTFKAEYAYDYGMPQWLARLDHMAAPLRLERLYLGRHKFHHFRVYYRDHFARYVREVLLDPRTLGRPYLRGEKIEAMVNGHLRGSQNHTIQIHQLLTTELVHRLLLDKN
jgi:asparagine synthase (glutamine-hydrolysing)